MQPGEVWKLIVRADELVKYASNRDEAAAYEQARAQLERAAEAARMVADPAVRENFVGQIRTRLEDIDRRRAPGT